MRGRVGVARQQALALPFRVAGAAAVEASGPGNQRRAVRVGSGFLRAFLSLGLAFIFVFQKERPDSFQS